MTVRQTGKPEQNDFSEEAGTQEFVRQWRILVAGQQIHVRKAASIRKKFAVAKVKILEEATPFVFHDPGLLEDGDLRLALVKTKAGEPGSGYIPTYFFQMRRVGHEEEIGSIKLRIGNTPHLVQYGGHIGYGVEPAYRGHHYAARACRLLLALARRHGLQTLWITCDPDNLASRKTCERLGATLVEIVNLPEASEMYQQGEQQKCRYRLNL